MRLPVQLDHAYLLLNHGPVVLLTSAHNGKRNVMAVSWSMPLDFNPPKVCVVIDKIALSRRLVDASQEFTLSVPISHQALMTKIVGTDSGTDYDKFDRLGIDVLQPSAIQAPLIAGCAAWLECRVLPEEHIQQKYDLFLAEVVAAFADSEYFENNRWKMTEDETRTLHYVAGGQFFETGRKFLVTDQR